MTELDTLEKQLLSDVAAASDEAAIEAVRVSALGKKGSVSELLKTLGTMSPEERQTRGAAINALKTRVTDAITERKTEMIRRGDAFIAFPGGTGTLEEIAEVMSKVSLKQLDAPCILYNLNGYYNGLKTLLDHMIETGLSTKERQEGIWFAENLEQIKQILKA